MSSPFAVLGTSPVNSSYMRGSSFRKSSFNGNSSKPGQPRRMSAASSAVATPSYVEPASEGSAFFSGRYGSQRRTSVSSSPTVSPETFSSGGVAVRPAQAPGVVVSGFSLDVPQHATFTGFSPIGVPQLQTAPSSRSATRGPGLLARALTSEQELTSSPSASAASLEASLANAGSQLNRGRSGAGSFWPDVDSTPLRRAQEQHAVFNNELVTMAYMVAARADQQQRRQLQQQQLDAMLAPSDLLFSPASQSQATQSQHISPGGMLTHCMAVAQLLADMGLDAETVAAGLLHEALRAGTSCISQMEEFLPSSVVSLVERARTISDISSLYRGHRASFGDEPFRRMLVAMEDVRAVLIKLADRVHVLRGAAALPPDAAAALAAESLEVFSVVANRLGVWCLKAELEDLAFGILHPAEASELRAALKDRQDAGALEATINTVKRSLEAHGVEYEDISGRPKNLYGVWLKLRGEVEAGSSSSSSGGGAEGASPPKTLDQIYDVTALRVVVANKHDCYRALRAVQEVYTTMPSRSKDFIKDIRKPNGYQSLHETVYAEGNRPMEVQIRTHKMHYIAEYGFAAHWKYKEKLDSEDQWLDKETQYKRWLTHYKLGVHDKKVRPDGSPPTDSSLKSLGVAFLGQEEASAPVNTPAASGKAAAATAAAVGSAGATSVAASGSSVGRVDPFLKHDRFRLATAPAEQTTVQLLLQTQDTIEARDVTGGMTAAAFGTQLGLGSAGIMAGYALLVNNRLPNPEALLRSGDLVQVVPASEAAARSPPRQVSPISAAFAAASAHSASAAAPTMAVTGKPPRPTNSSRSASESSATTAQRALQQQQQLQQQTRREKGQSLDLQQLRRLQAQHEGLQLFGIDLTSMPQLLGPLLGGGNSRPMAQC